MNNKDEYFKAVNQIEVSEELKRKTMQNIKEKDYLKNPIIRFVGAAVALLLVLSIGLLQYNKNEQTDNPISLENPIAVENPKEIIEEDDLPRFANIDELKKILEENQKSQRNAMTKGITSDVTNATDSFQVAAEESESFSRTNTQVENVDEADIVKTDGKYIYYVQYRKVLIIEANSLKQVAEIKIEGKDERFNPIDIYINENKLIIMGNYYKETVDYYSNQEKNREAVYIDRVYARGNYMAMAIVYDISNRENPKQVRKVAIDGNYDESRMIGDNIYFISNKYLYYYNDLKDDEILPVIEENGVRKQIPVTDIVYFKDSTNMNYMMVAGFNINDNKEVNVETFFGSSGTIYASENNLYVAEPNYWYSESEKTIIYKFSLKDSFVKLLCKGEIEGSLKNQFSMDEYNGNLRIAVTLYNYRNNDEEVNRLYVLDKDMNIIGKIDDMAKGEKIYSVRFIGNKGYIVTFKQIDPLFVIDLSNPTNPELKGELKIPGYSSYLHPYDENHIIGIGYNTKSNGYGGITNSTMKMSMFDVSDVSNPKEMFNVTIGNEYTYSEIINNHKSLFYNKEKNLIGFPVTFEDYDYTSGRNGFIIYKIDLQNGFEKYCTITQPIDYNNRIQRSIYIGNTLYTISNNEIRAYDLITFEEKGNLIFENEYEIEGYLLD